MAYHHPLAGTAYLNLEAVARGLGFTRTAASGNEVVMWSRVESYLQDLGVHTCAHDGFIPENIFYRLAMKAPVLSMRWCFTTPFVGIRRFSVPLQCFYGDSIGKSYISPIYYSDT